MTPAVALALPLIRRFEGLRLDPYQDPAGIWSIGYGFRLWNNRPVTASTPPIAPDEAEARLAELAAQVESQVRCICRPLADNECAALICFTFNEGIGRLATSTLLKLWNAGDKAGAGQQFMSWVYGGGRVLEGLVARRAAERALFETAAEITPEPAETGKS